MGGVPIAPRAENLQRKCSLSPEELYVIYIVVTNGVSGVRRRSDRLLGLL
jgi:hypothetical protein